MWFNMFYLYIIKPLNEKEKFKIQNFRKSYSLLSDIN